MGRPSRYNEAVAAALIEAIRWGVPRAIAAAYAGISSAAFFRWVKLGRAGRKPYRDLVEQIEKCEAEALVRSVQRIRKAGEDPKHWTAEAWFLERRASKEFGRKWQVEGAVGTVEETRLTGDEEGAMLEGIKRVLGAFKIQVTEGGETAPALPPPRSGNDNS